MDPTTVTDVTETTPLSEPSNRAKLRASLSVVVPLSVFFLGLFLGFKLSSLPIFQNSKSSPVAKHTNIINTPIASDSALFYSIADMDIQINLDGILERELNEAPYTTIPGTILKIKLPKSFTVEKNHGDGRFANLTTVISIDGRDAALPRFYKDYNACSNYPPLQHVTPTPTPVYINSAFCDELFKINSHLTSQQTGDINLNQFYFDPSFSVSVVDTDQSPVEWFGENAYDQGGNFKTIIPDSSTWLTKIPVTVYGGYVTMYTRDFRGVDLSAVVYIYPYSYQGNKKLVVFMEYGHETTVLNKILSTLVAPDSTKDPPVFMKP